MGETEFEVMVEQEKIMSKQINKLKAENERLKKSNRNLKLQLETFQLPEIQKVLTDWRTGELDLQINRYKSCLQEIKEITIALYMNEWLQMNETARKSIQLLQEKIAECEVNE